MAEAKATALVYRLFWSEADHLKKEDGRWRLVSGLISSSEVSVYDAYKVPPEEVAGIVGHEGPSGVLAIPVELITTGGSRLVPDSPEVEGFHPAHFVITPQLQHKKARRVLRTSRIVLPMPGYDVFIKDQVG
jgi:hypothetical protein